MQVPLTFYTPREKAFLSGAFPKGDQSLKIEPLKKQVAELFPEGNWDRIYFLAKAIGNALAELANLNTCIRDKWEWYIPKTPTRIFIEGVEYPIYPVAHSAKADEILKVIWDRPRLEVVQAVEVLKVANFPGVRDITLESEDINKCFLTLAWHGDKYPQTRNMIYLHKGSQWRGKK